MSELPAIDIRKLAAQFGINGCGDNSCYIARPSGMGTNGGCRCRPDKFVRIIQRMALPEFRELALIRAALDRVVEYLEGSTFGEREIPTVRSCVALIRSLDPQTIRQGVKEDSRLTKTEGEK